MLQTVSRIECGTCHSLYQTYYIMDKLPLTIPTGTQSCSLTDCLVAFTMVELMDGENALDCPRCGAQRPSTKQVLLL